MKIETINFSDKEKELIDAIAARRGITRDEAASQLLSEGLAYRVRCHIRKPVPRNVLTMPRGK